jgi:hypothetical protein
VAQGLLCTATEQKEFGEFNKKYIDNLWNLFLAFAEFDWSSDPAPESPTGKGELFDDQEDV